MSRKAFLLEFLGALGAIEIQWQNETGSKITGTAIYGFSGSEETQDFVWHKFETDIPNQDVMNLAKLIHEQDLLSIDQIKVTRSELRAKYNSRYGVKITEQQFSITLELLEEIEVPMVDDGRETDAYFIHE